MNESSHYPMHCIGTDLFEYNNKPYLIVVDYFSLYPWIRPLRNISSLSVIEAMKSVFSEFGYPDKIHSDSGSQYSSKEFNSFTMEYDIKHSMSSPHYHESNGKSERVHVEAYKSIKRKHNINFRQIGHTTSQYGQSFFPKTISAWNGLVFAEAPSLAVFRSNFIIN